MFVKKHRHRCLIWSYLYRCLMDTTVSLTCARSRASSEAETAASTRASTSTLRRFWTHSKSYQPHIVYKCPFCVLHGNMRSQIWIQPPFVGEELACSSALPPRPDSKHTSEIVDFVKFHFSKNEYQFGHRYRVSMSAHYRSRGQPPHTPSSVSATLGLPPAPPTCSGAREE